MAMTSRSTESIRTKPHRRALCILLLVILTLLRPAPSHSADSVAPETILIRDVRLFSGKDQSETITVYVLVKEMKLHIVTQDEIPLSEATLAIDAQGGFIMGTMHIGQLANFLILAEDPRENVKVLLDTRTHTRFAIHDGEILVNNLPLASDVDAQTSKSPKRSGWLAYTPPPMALPQAYRDDTKWNRLDTRYVSGMLLAALILDRQFWLSQDANSEQQVGNLDDFEGGEIRGFRLGAVGTLNFARPWVYTFFVATNAFDRGFDAGQDDGMTLFDYRLDIPLPGWTTLSVGKQKEPISMERIISLTFIGMQERSSAADALLPSRNVGFVLSGTGIGKRMTWAGGVFNDWFDAGQSFSSGANQFAGRLTALAMKSEDESGLVHVGAGVRLTDAKEPIRYATEPEFEQAPLFVDTGELDAENAWTFNAELSLRRGPIWLHGEYLRTELDAPALLDPSFSGYNVTGTWALTGEMRRYIKENGTFSPLPVSKSVYRGGWGAWEVAARWSDLDLTGGSVDGGQMRIASLGLNWWLSPVFYVGVNYRHIRLDRFGMVGDSDGLNMRLVLLLE